LKEGHGKRKPETDVIIRKKKDEERRSKPERCTAVYRPKKETRTLGERKGRSQSGSPFSKQEVYALRRVAAVKADPREKRSPGLTKGEDESLTLKKKRLRLKKKTAAAKPPPPGKPPQRQDKHRKPRSASSGRDSEKGERGAKTPPHVAATPPMRVERRLRGEAKKRKQTLQEHLGEGLHWRKPQSAGGNL